jgi:hypothetical protein
MQSVRESVRRHSKSGWVSVDENVERRYWAAGVQDLIDKYAVYEEALPAEFWERISRIPLTPLTKHGLDTMAARWESLSKEEQQTRINMPLAVALLQMVAAEIERLQSKAAIAAVKEQMHRRAEN